MTVGFINFSRHSITVDRAHGTGLIILTQNNSQHCNTSHCWTYISQYTHMFNSRLSRTTLVSRYPKGKTNLDFNEATDSEWQVKPNWILLKQETVSGNGICWAICKSAPCSRQIAMPAPHHSVFYRPDALPATQPTASKQNISLHLKYVAPLPCEIWISVKWRQSKISIVIKWLMINHKVVQPSILAEMAYFSTNLSFILLMKELLKFENI